MVGSFIFLNLVVAVIIDTFSNLSDLNPNLASREDIEVFKEAWSRRMRHRTYLHAIALRPLALRPLALRPLAHPSPLPFLTPSPRP